MDGRVRLLDKDAIDPLPFEEEEPRRVSWCGRVWSSLGAVGSLALRLVDYSRWTNAAGSLATGFFAGTALQTFFEDNTLERARKVAETCFGSLAVLALSQCYANNDDQRLKDFSVHLIIAGLGVNLAIFTKRMIEYKFVRMEVLPLDEDSGEKMRLFTINQNLVDLFKISAAALSAYVYFRYDDPFSGSATSFLAPFYLSQIVGGRVSQWINKKIKERDKKTLSYSNEGGTRFRVAQTAINAIGFFFRVLVAFPLTSDPDTDQRRSQIPLIGISGFFDQFMHQSQIERLKNFSVKELKEFESLHDPEESKTCYRVWRLSTRVVSALAVAGFGIWQGVSLNNQIQKTDLAAMMGSFFGTLGLCCFVDRKFRSEKRHWLIDTLMTNLLIAPRIFAIDPWYFAAVGTNAEKIDSQQIAMHGNSTSYEAMAGLTWAGTMFTAARDLYESTWGLKGPMRPPWMATTYQANTFRLNLEGVI